ncbi:MAG: hypothetical protein IJ679_07355 [Lachnospiraceae bacterium]|nr:hypothetical protein [Lachnospiraceae bacterium]
MVKRHKSRREKDMVDILDYFGVKYDHSLYSLRRPPTTVEIPKWGTRKWVPDRKYEKHCVSKRKIIPILAGELSALCEVFSCLSPVNLWKEEQVFVWFKP